ncbi:MAG: hypothetical protein HC918_05140 [Oscillatoriales cyanobacterium SM2_1_8]|nr:hypothetical protein [Oscillatoriales cyanobacterium SM2_1_8]
MVSLEEVAIARPDPSELLSLMQQTEKQRDRRPLAYERLIGTWRLLWVANARKQRGRGVQMGAGRYLPAWLGITLTYTPAQRVENRVQLGPVALTLTGPVRCAANPSILAFDFTAVQVQWGNRTLYQGTMRGGAAAEAQFPEKPLREQAFFVYFYVGLQAIAARGRGGGLALWHRLGTPSGAPASIPTSIPDPP